MAGEQFHARRLHERRQELARRMAELRADAEHWNRTHPDDEPIVVDMDLGPEVVAALSATITCTGIAASWCPIHGDCTCPEPEDRKDHEGCPLHGRESNHPDGYATPSAKGDADGE